MKQYVIPLTRKLVVTIKVFIPDKKNPEGGWDFQLTENPD
jgi:hypothetical protein